MCFIAKVTGSFHLSESRELNYASVQCFHETVISHSFIIEYILKEYELPCNPFINNHSICFNYEVKPVARKISFLKYIDTSVLFLNATELYLLIYPEKIVA